MKILLGVYVAFDDGYPWELGKLLRVLGIGAAGYKADVIGAVLSKF